MVLTTYLKHHQVHQVHRSQGIWDTLVVNVEGVIAAYTSRLLLVTGCYRLSPVITGYNRLPVITGYNRL